MVLIPEDFLDTVVAIGARDVDDQTKYVGTGFLYARSVEERRDGRTLFSVFLVTNRHVLEPLTEGFLRFSPRAHRRAEDYPVRFTRKNGKQLWTGHPSPDIDVAVLSVDYAAIVKRMKVSFFDERGQVARLSDIAEQGISEGDALWVLGFPFGDVGVDRNAVIVRSGTIARIREALSGGQPRFLLDTFVFPGNSGGPVVFRPSGQTLSGTNTPDRPYLIGLIESYVPWIDEAVSRQSGETRVTFEENSGLAWAIAVDCIDECIDVALSRAKRKAPPRKPVRRRSARKGD